MVGGCAQSDALMFGAPALTARAALRAGSGLVRLVVPDPVLVPALQLIPEATGRGLIVDEDGCVVPHKAAGALDAALGDADVVAVGPGMGPGGEVEGVVLRALGQSEKPVVVDADGLNALSRVSGFEREVRAGAVFTPHPGEFSRL
ncbi:MAG: NAD(P)H-hydrate dehydratase, partial [Planctomycetota bacterium]